MASDDLLFPVRVRGDNARAFLDNIRWGLRQMRDPKTGLAFSDDQIAIATAPHSELAIKADGIDAVTFLNQQRALWMAAQNIPSRAASVTLRERWANIWELPYLNAAGGSGTVLSPCAAGTTFKGSTTLDDPAAVQGRDPAGKRYQVLFTRKSVGTTVQLDLVAIDTGEDTNIPVSTPITWINPPLTAPVEGTVVNNARFSGGIEAETDAQYIVRLLFRIRHKPGSGNRAQNVAWVFEAAQNAIDMAWVYGGAWHAGSTLIAVAQKRGSTAGPLARVPTVATMGIVSAYLESVIPVTPGPPAVVALPVVPISTDLVLSLSMGTDTPAGFADAEPWPQQDAGTPAAIVSIVNQGLFTISCTVDPPSSTALPRMMVWDVDTSSFIELSVSDVTAGGAGEWIITLVAPPAGHTFADGDVISPWTEQAPLIASTLTAYADSLGAGEVLDVSSGSTDDRRGYAFRWPKPNEQNPSTAGSAVISYLQDAMGGALANASLESLSVSTPPLPADPIDGPGLLVLGKVGVYSG